MAIIAHWKSNTFSQFAKLDAQNVYDELMIVGSNNPLNEIPNQDVVDYARNHMESELYKAFEWDDSIAAEAYRRTEARIIKNSLYTFELENPQVQMEDHKEIPLFLNPSHDSLKQHAPTQIVMSKPDLRQATLEKALRELKSFETRYSFLTELSIVFDAIDSLNIP